ncbi:MAG: NAD(P)-binding protein [Deltaproteobacteria bacterium]|nr:NAD(P)-binding protein [Deltaproteobacteria bacterium]
MGSTRAPLVASMKMDAVVVGAGLAGLAAAETLVDAGLQVVVLERGDAPGSKNVTGGRLYVESIRDQFPEWWAEAPLERPVTHEAWTLLDEGKSLRVDFQDEALAGGRPRSYTVLRAKLDAWLGDRIAQKGAFVIPQKPVAELLWEGSAVAGVRVDGEEIPAEVVIACDGLLSFVGRAAKVSSRPAAKTVAVGVKEVLGLPAGTIEDRFQLEPGEGAAELFLGGTRGLLGGGFCYTNRESLSLGLVIGVEDLMGKGRESVPDLFEAFKAHPRVRSFVRDGELLEYSAHLIPEGGLDALPRLVENGLLMAGDAAGLALNMGYTVRGMEFAAASGRMAAQTVLEAREKGDYSAETLASYLRRLRESFVWKYLEAYREMPRLLENPDFFARYPREVCRLFQEVVRLENGRPGKLSGKVWDFLRKNVVNWRDLKALNKLRQL